MDRDSVIFCIGSLAVSLVVAMVAFPFAAMDAETVAAAEKPKPVYEMGSVDVGKGFGEVPVEDLMSYYIENPPAAKTSDAGAAPEIRFGGC
ncbi:hypothetical protein [Magnetovibrio sp.]|uniref:hypothetical protein n=1 Tax=Magnetovibrio sp. TaxID=2024836 RepID=UPI002F94E8EA